MDNMNFKTNVYVIGKDEASLKKNKKLTKKRMKYVHKSRVRSLGLIERLVMIHSGRVDGRKGLLCSDPEGKWFSSFLKHEVDSFEEFSAEEIAKLKIGQEASFTELNILFDRYAVIKKVYLETKERLSLAESKELDLTERKEGEEHLNDTVIRSRRMREREKELAPLRDQVAEYELQLNAVVNTVFIYLSEIRETFDSTVKMIDRLEQRCQRRVDVYWRSALRFIPELPQVPDVSFTRSAVDEFYTYYEQVREKADSLKKEMELLYHKEVA